MKKLVYIVTVFFINLFVIKNIYAFEFYKSIENPLKASYIDDYVYLLQANIFKEESLYKGIFVIKKQSESFHSLGYFESTNGLDWVMFKEILNIGSDLSNPRILKTQTGYFLFISRFESDRTYQIYLSNCDTNFNCSENLLPVISADKNKKTEKYGVFSGSPFQQDDRTFLFFSARGENGFKIKLAYSDDLITWHRCPNDKEFLYDGDGPFSYTVNNYLYLFFHRADNSGIRLAKSSLPLTCDSVFEDEGYLLRQDKSYDQRHLIFPSVLGDGENFKLFYSGFGDDYQWHLNLACTGQRCLLGSENPIPTKKIPIVIVPGTFASWNRDAILHNREVSYNDWKLQNFVKEYDGLINTLINLGYEINKDLFIFPFDWRQEIEKTAGDLDSFLKKKIWTEDSDKKINIIGHSLGGLIGRIFAQKNKDKVNQIITVGTPHQGVVQVYKPLESGEIDRDNTFFWLALKIVLILNKTTIETDRLTLANKFPAAKDLFPAFNFLKDSSGNEINFNKLKIKNTFLPQYNQSFSDIFPIFTAIYGENGKNTPAGFIVEPQNSLDQLLGNYSDGKPKESYFDFGDYTVLSKSAKQDSDAEKLSFDHGGLIYKKDSIKKILDLLHIEYKDSQVVEGKGTTINSSLIFLIKSPATMEVELNSHIYNEEDGIIFIPNAQSGNYNLKVQGTDKGKYELVIGQISENNDLWESLNGETNNSQIDNHNILYNNQTAVSLFPISTATPFITSIPTGQIYLSPTTISSPTFIQQSTNSSAEILGISSYQKKLITPTVKINKKIITKKEIKKSTIWDFILPSLLISSLLTTLSWHLKKNK
ncbi:MAG: alpha/beta fold hydrolase [Patescibacteria group bacterium]|jgi:pimeloyl-ACP methyl ester carboxylesterase